MAKEEVKMWLFANYTKMRKEIERLEAIVRTKESELTSQHWENRNLERMLENARSELKYNSRMNKADDIAKTAYRTLSSGIISSEADDFMKLYFQNAINDLDPNTKKV
jgi:hypothetical protein